MKTYEKIIDTAKLFEIQNKQYTEKLLLSDTVPASSTRLAKTSITSLGHFLCLRITGNFETLTQPVEEPIVDDGICHLRGKMIDECTNRALFNDYIPFDLFLTPGRVKSSNSTGVLTDPLGNPMFWPDEFVYLFAVNSDISIDVKNDSLTAIKYNIAFHGIRIRV